MYSQNFFHESSSNMKNQKILVLTHPTVDNLQSFMKLEQQGLVDLSGIQIVGVYYKQENYDYSRTKNYLDTLDHSSVRISLHAVKDTLSQYTLFRKNALSDDFYRIFKQSTGVVFFGGPDLPPSIYKENTRLLTNISDPDRHYFEISFLYHLLGGKEENDFSNYLAQDSSYLIYGFCLGMQSMNVAAGGSLIQDIPSELYGLQYAEKVLAQDHNKQHRNYNRVISTEDDLLAGTFHQIHFLKESYLKSCSPEQILPAVYSNHHQAVKTLGKGFEKIASSIDEKVIEAIQHKAYPNVKGVQFHPEHALLYDSTIHFELTPEDRQPTTGPEILKEAASQEFYQNFWEDFSRRLQED